MTNQKRINRNSDSGCSCSSISCTGCGCEGMCFIGGLVVIASVIPASIGFFYDLKEILEELWFKERVLTNLAALATTATLAYIAVPMILTALAPHMILGAVAAIIAVAIALKVARWAFNALDRSFNNGLDSRFNECGTDLKEAAKQTWEMGLFGTNQTYRELEQNMRDEKNPHYQSLSA